MLTFYGLKDDDIGASNASYHTIEYASLPADNDKNTDWNALIEN